MPTDRPQDVETIRAALRWVPWHRVVAPELGSPHAPIQSEANAALDRLVTRLEAAEREASEAQFDAKIALPEAQERFERAERDVEGYRRALVAHHDIATLSEEVLAEYDYRRCPVCARAALVKP